MVEPRDVTQIVDALKDVQGTLKKVQEEIADALQVAKDIDARTSSKDPSLKEKHDAS